MSKAKSLTNQEGNEGEDLIETCSLQQIIDVPIGQVMFSKTNAKRTSKRDLKLALEMMSLSNLQILPRFVYDTEANDASIHLLKISSGYPCPQTQSKCVAPQA